ncbi:hypothetical protein HYU09_05030 [Candidatus Woesearchaeota archaeon]|nr:hypothetical protein [Candidatus Woesearchaeota archaeon]
MLAAAGMAAMAALPSQTDAASLNDYFGFLRVEVGTEAGDAVQTPNVPQLTQSQLEAAIKSITDQDPAEFAAQNNGKYIALTPEQAQNYFKGLGLKQSRQVMTLPQNDNGLTQRVISGEWNDGKVKGGPDSLDSNMEFLTGYGGKKVGALLTIYRKGDQLMFPVTGTRDRPYQNGTQEVSGPMGDLTRREVELIGDLTGKQKEVQEYLAGEKDKLTFNKDESYKILTGLAAETVYRLHNFQLNQLDPVTGEIRAHKINSNFATITQVKRGFDGKVEIEPEGSKYRVPVAMTGKPQYISNGEAKKMTLGAPKK